MDQTIKKITVHVSYIKDDEEIIIKLNYGLSKSGYILDTAEDLNGRFLTVYYAQQGTGMKIENLNPLGSTSYLGTYARIIEASILVPRYLTFY